MPGTESTEIVEAEPLVSPADPKRVLEVMRRFEEFKRQALTPNDFVVLDLGKEKRPYIKKSGWMKYALACQLSLEKRDERPEEHPDGSKVYHYTYRAMAPNGRYADAVGSASTAERTFAHPDHDVRALAQTRACNRAISNLVAGGEVSAEEMISDIKEGTTTQPESPVLGTEHPAIPVTPEHGSLAAIDDATLAAELDRLPWQLNKSGKEGSHLRWDDVPHQFRAKLGLKLNEINEKQYLNLGRNSYRRFGDNGEWLARYPRNEVTRTESPSTAPDNSWRVPVTANQATPAQTQEGLRQIPLLKDLKSFGTVNILQNEISIVPERPVARNSALIDGFLISRVVDPIVTKHKLTYAAKVTSNGLLEGILIRGKLSDQQVKELISGARWAFEKSLQKETRKEVQ